MIPSNKQPIDPNATAIAQQVDPHESKPFIYLASLHSHPDEIVRNARFLAVSQYMAMLIEQGNLVFCPIAHTHTAARFVPQGKGDNYNYWRQLDEFYLAKCDVLMLYVLPETDKSYGCAEECDFAKDNGKPIIVIDSGFKHNDELVEEFCPLRHKEGKPAHNRQKEDTSGIITS